eukprot:Skav235316  [mRNA]  locus=scaffold520:432547:432915:- [translate_table: standard]
MQHASHLIFHLLAHGHGTHGTHGNTRQVATGGRPVIPGNVICTSLPSLARLASRSFMKGSSFSTMPPLSCPRFIFSEVQRFCVASTSTHGRFSSMQRSPVRRSSTAVLVTPLSTSSRNRRSV